MNAIVASTNERLRTELPTLREQQHHLAKELEDVKSQADALINEWAALASDGGTAFLKEKLDDLGKRRGQIEKSLAALKIAIGEVKRDTVDQGLVTQALADFSAILAELKPYQQKELMGLVLHKAILGSDCLKLGLYGRPPEVRPFTEGDSRFQTLKWLPGRMPQSVVLWDRVTILAQRIARRHLRLLALPHLDSLPCSHPPRSN